MSFVISGSISMIKFTPMTSTIILTVVIGSLPGGEQITDSAPSTSPSTTPPSGGEQITDSAPSTSVTSSIA